MGDTMDALNTHRQITSGLLIALGWALAAITITSALSLGAPVSLGLAGLAVTGFATAYWLVMKNGAATRVLIAIASVINVSLLLAAMDGHSWQVDLHMAYFAVLALICIYCDWRAILAATATVALHHLGLNMLLPAAIYPGGADFLRVVLHAVILVTEAAGLMWVAHRLTVLFAVSEEKSHEAKAAQLKAEATLAELRASQASADRVQAERNALSAIAETEAETRVVVDAMAGALMQLANGDLTVRLDQAFNSEFEDLRRSFNTAIEQLEATIRMVQASTDSIHSGSREMSTASGDLAHRTEQQAASLEEAAAALNEVTASVRETAGSAAEARKVVNLARTGAEHSSEIVRNATDAMAAIESSSSQVSRIIEVIDEIAFQTNLLALNAGVEAARAGDAGRGFAVVATEVRALASRSAEAAKEIKALISVSRQHVETGSSLVVQTRQELLRIVEQVSGVTEIVEHIARNATEQATRVQEINSAVGNIDSMTQQNAAIVEESTAASVSLANESDEMAELVGKFRTNTRAEGKGRRTAGREASGRAAA